MGIPGPVGSHDAPSVNKLTNNTFVAFGDLDASPTKAWMIGHRHDARWASHYQLGFGKRPRHELYDLKNDPHQVDNVAGRPEFAAVQQRLNDQLMAELTRTGDPRVGNDPIFEKPPFTNPK